MNEQEIGDLKRRVHTLEIVMKRIIEHLTDLRSATIMQLSSIDDMLAYKRTIPPRHDREK